MTLYKKTVLGSYFSTLSALSLILFSSQVAEDQEMVSAGAYSVFQSHKVMAYN